MPGCCLRPILIVLRSDIFVKLADEVVFKVEFCVKREDDSTNYTAHKEKTSNAGNHFDRGELGQHVHFLLLVRNLERHPESVRIVLSELIGWQAFDQGLAWHLVHFVEIFIVSVT